MTIRPHLSQPAEIEIVPFPICPHGCRMGEATRLMEAANKGDPQAASELLPLVYQELRQIASRHMSGESPTHTLQPTALVHEAWLRLNGQPDNTWKGRAHFLAAAAEAMRRILIDQARRKLATRRGNRPAMVELDEILIGTEEPDDRLIALNDALAKLESVNKVEAELVKLRYFVGLTIEDASEVLGISPRSAKYYWTHARAWLYREIQRGSS